MNIIISLDGPNGHIIQDWDRAWDILNGKTSSEYSCHSLVISMGDGIYRTLTYQRCPMGGALTYVSEDNAMYRLTGNEMNRSEDVLMVSENMDEVMVSSEYVVAITDCRDVLHKFFITNVISGLDKWERL